MIAEPLEPEVSASSADAPQSALSRRLLAADAELARLARCEAQLRLQTGELLDALFQRGGHFELGFSSFDGYVLERCERGRSWGRETRALARRLREKGLEATRRAIFAGRIGSSMAELLARYATADNEAELLEEATRSTFRAMQAKLTGKSPAQSDAEADVDELRVRPTRWASAQEIAMLAASRMLVEHLTNGVKGDETLVGALLGEGETTLLAIAEKRGGVGEFPAVDGERLKQALMRTYQIRRARRRSPGGAVAPVPLIVEPFVDQGLPTSLRGLDREIRRCCRELARRNIEMGRAARELFQAAAWRVLGYESPRHYVTERYGLSLSSVEHRMTLARRVASHAAILQAVEDGTIGYEATQLIARVVGRWSSKELVNAWIDRARRRTVKHLKQDVGVVMLAVSFDQRASPYPPNEEELEAVFEFERKVQTGEILRSYFAAALPGPKTSVTLVAANDEEGRCDRAALRLTMSADLYASWSNVETQFKMIAGSDASFITFLCTSLWATWLPFLEKYDEKWKDIFVRDRHECSNPVCERHDVTPHHVTFKSRGGTDAAGNMSSACWLCHLEGIHGGRLKVDGDASKLTWLIGREPILKVVGREKIPMVA